jgi:hypothetical protein
VYGDETREPTTHETPMKTILSARILALAATGMLVAGLASCVPVAAGAAAGYIAHDEGVRVQSPITTR